MIPMHRITKLLLIALFLAGSVQHIKAFSLLGPATTWMTTRLGYNLNAMGWPPGEGWGGGGPMNFAEEYRLNVPVVTYGFTPAFLNYFGQRGVEEIDKTMAILNALPEADQIDPDAFPLSSQRLNHRARALQLADIKSFALSLMVNQMGLADPTRFVFTLRNRWTTEFNTNYFVIQRNFDPITWQYSPYINGQLWTFTSVLETIPGESFAVNEPVDPLALGGLMNVPVASGVEGNGLLLLGGFWTGLTRDDVGGLRYIYRRNNFNVENAPTNALALGFGAGAGSPWSPPPVTTNGVAIPGATTNFVDQALRPGIGKVSFVRMDRESVFGNFISNNISWVDVIITNGIQFEQTLVRVAIAPDIIFDAGDLQGGDGTDSFTSHGIASVEWISSGDGATTFGPGVIPVGADATPALSVTFNTVGPTWFSTFSGGAFISPASEAQSSLLWRWGSFDGSTDPPIVYPDTQSILQLEQMVLADPTARASLVDPWTPAAFLFPPVAPGVGDPGGGGGGDFGDGGFF
jgi:hypothetical protein